MNTAFFYYEITDLNNDLVDQIGALSVSSIPILNLPSVLSGVFFTDSNVDGKTTLCVTKLVGQPLDLVINANNPNLPTYTVQAKPFVAVPDQSAIFGTHPTVLFKPGSTK